MEDITPRTYGTSALDNRPLFGETSARVGHFSLRERLDVTRRTQCVSSSRLRLQRAVVRLQCFRHAPIPSIQFLYKQTIFVFLIRTFLPLSQDTTSHASLRTHVLVDEMKQHCFVTHFTSVELQHFKKTVQLYSRFHCLKNVSYIIASIYLFVRLFGILYAWSFRYLAL